MTSHTFPAQKRADELNDAREKDREYVWYMVQTVAIEEEN